MKKTALLLLIVLAMVFTGCVSSGEAAPEVLAAVDMFATEGATIVELPAVAATASGYHMEKGLVPDFAIDGDMETTWTVSGEQWIQIDLGAVKKVAYLEIAMLKGSERKYKVMFEASTDGMAYTTVLGNTTSSGMSDEMEMYDVANVEAQYIKINVDGADSSDWNNFKEVKVYGVE